MSEPAEEFGPTADEEFADYSAQARKHKWPPWAATFLTALSRVPNVSRAAEEAGINPSTAHSWAVKNDAFSDALEEAREVALDRLESTIYLRATVGSPIRKTITKTRELPDGGREVTTIETEERHVSDILAMFYLKKWRPEYRDSYRVEQTGLDGGPIEVMTEERVHEAAERFRAEVVRLSAINGTGEASSNGRG